MLGLIGVALVGKGNDIGRATQVVIMLYARPLMGRFTEICSGRLAFATIRKPNRFRGAQFLDVCLCCL